MHQVGISLILISNYRFPPIIISCCMKGELSMKYPVVDMKETGLRIRELMKKNNIKVRDIVEYMGFESEQSVYKWLRGDSLPKVDNLFALARLFGTPMDNIIIEREGEDESPLFPLLWNSSIIFLNACCLYVNSEN